MGRLTLDQQNRPHRTLTMRTIPTSKMSTPDSNQSCTIMNPALLRPITRPPATAVGYTS